MTQLTLHQRIKNLAKEIHPEMVAIRRHLHKNPEVSYKEFKTTEFILLELEKLGIETHQPLETGCIGVIKGGRKSDRVIALRADIDALPMEESGDAKTEFLSENKGAAHCCGHDAHTSNLLGTAKILTQLKDEIEGTVVLVFQPGEEKLPGGGRLLSESGILQKLGVQAIYGLHTSPQYEPGKIGVIYGNAMARPDEFSLDIIGKGGHAAAPHLAVDPIVTASQVISALQTIRSRNINPLEPVVVTVGKIEGGTACNVIPEKVSMLGTIRSFSQETAHFMAKRIEEIAKGITEAAGGTYKFKYDEGYPAVVNVEWAVDAIADSTHQLFGEESLVWMPEPVMGGEDFAFYLEHFPGAFFLLGSGSDKADSKYSWHHPKYNVDEDCMLYGSALMASIALNSKSVNNGI